MMKPQAPVFVYISIGLAGFWVIISILFVIKYCIAKKDRDIQLRTVIMTILASLFYGLSMIFLITFEFPRNSTKFGKLSNGLKGTFWHLGNITLYSFLLCRLYCYHLCTHLFD